MIVMDEDEYVEMRLKVKCTGQTKRFGRGMFVLTGKRVLYESEKEGLCLDCPISKLNDFRKWGKYEFHVGWDESGHHYTFRAEIQKHYKKRPDVEDLAFRLDEVTDYTMYPGDELLWRDGWKVNAYGAVYNRYMPECDKYIRKKTLSPEMEEIVEEVENEKWKARMKDGAGVFIAEGKTIPLSVYYSVNKMQHENEAAEVEELEGKTYEEQRRFRRHAFYAANYADCNYDYLYGCWNVRIARKNMEIVHTKYLEKDIALYEEIVESVTKDIEAHDGDATWLEAERDYSAEAARINGAYKYADKSWFRQEERRRKYITKPLLFTGTAHQFFERMRKEVAVLKRIRDIMLEEYPKFEYLRNFWFRVYELHEALSERLEEGKDIEEHVSPTQWEPAMKRAKELVADFERNLEEP